KAGERKYRRHGITVRLNQCGVGKSAQQRAELLQMLRRLQNPTAAAAQDLQGLENVLEIAIAVRMIDALVIAAVSGNAVAPLEQHRGERKEKLRQVLVGLVDQQLVHPLEIRRAGISEIDRLLDARDPWIGDRLSGPRLAVRQRTHLFPE